ncbi:MAG: esterase-like activity of phytase family protein [Pseudomonadota bacterium]
MKAAPGPALFLVALFFLLTPTHLLAQKSQAISIEAIPVQFSLLDPDSTTIGELRFRGGLELRSRDKRFGGFSGVVLTRGGTRLIAVSDQAWWLNAKLDYEGGRLNGLSEARFGPLTDPKGRRWKHKRSQDAEAISLFGTNEDAGVLVGFERRPRLLHYHLNENGLKRKPKAYAVPRAMGKGKNNKELEAAGRFTSGPHAGRFIAISELHKTAEGNIRGWIWSRPRRPVEFAVKRRGNYAVTDLALLQGGDMLILERRLALFRLPGVAIRLIRASDLKPAATVDGRVLMEAQAPAHLVDNMEGLAVHRLSNGDLILTIMSDDNYNRAQQRTLIYQFAWPKAQQ